MYLTVDRRARAGEARPLASVCAHGVSRQREDASCYPARVAPLWCCTIEKGLALITGGWRNGSVAVSKTAGPGSSPGPPAILGALCSFRAKNAG